MATKTCPVCETDNELGAKHCEVCGEPLPIPSAEPTDTSPAAPPADTSVNPSASALAHGSAASPPPSTGPSQGGPSETGPSQKDARNALDAAAPDSADKIAESMAPEADSPSVLEGDDKAALDKFDELLASEGDIPAPRDEAAAKPLGETKPAPTPTPAPTDANESAARTAGGTTRQARDTIVDHPTVERTTPAPAEATASLVVYKDREPVHTYDIVHDETLIGRTDPTSDAYPDLDLTEWDDGSQISRKHCYLLREGGEYYVRPISNAGTQLNKHLLDIGSKTEIEDGDVLILAGALAMKFKAE